MRAPVSVAGGTRCLDEVAVAAAGQDEQLGAGTELLTAWCSNRIPLCHPRLSHSSDENALLPLERSAPGSAALTRTLQEGCGGFWASWVSPGLLLTSATWD